ncbi:hypothetical protein [Micromonospora sp. NPDC005652]|uniref:hypothetical protein n=1 Tax=Micromonospora sp. NPDC005652 TaxID=3157046 RepID=UPI0033C2F33A
MSDELAELRRKFAAAHEVLNSLPEHPTSPEDLAKLGKVRRFLNGERGLATRAAAPAVADLYYLEGLTQAEIGKLLGITAQAVGTNLLDKRGPKEYLVVRQTVDGPLLRRIPVEPDWGGTSYRQLRKLRDEGWRVAPAALRLNADEVDGAELWNRLGETHTQR